MSTRRNTRATSVASSGVAASVAASDVPNTPAPRRSGRHATPSAVSANKASTNKKQKRPKQTSRASAMYGDEGTAEPDDLNETAANQTGALTGRLGGLPEEPEEEDDGDGASQFTPTPYGREYIDQSTFNEELIMQAHGKFDTSSITDVRQSSYLSRPVAGSRVGGASNLRQRVASPNVGTSSSGARRYMNDMPQDGRGSNGSTAAALMELARETRVATPEVEDHENAEPGRAARVGEFFQNILNRSADGFHRLKRWASFHWIYFAVPFFLMLLLGSTFLEPGYSHIGRPIHDSARRILSSLGGQGSSSAYNYDQRFTSLETRMSKYDQRAMDHENRISSIESDVTELKEATGLHSASIKKLEEILPNVLAFKQDSEGNLLIPDVFYSALRNKLRADATIFTNSGGKLSRVKDLSIDEMKKIAASTAKDEVAKANKEWAAFLEQNNAAISKRMDDRYNNIIDNSRSNVDVDRSDVVAELQRQWKENTEERTQLVSRVQGLETRSKHHERLFGEVVYKQSYDLRISHWVRQHISEVQIEQLAQNGLLAVNKDLERYNFFAKNAGAYVIPHLTSPNYLPEQGRGPMGLPLWFLGMTPRVKEPVTALMPWSEAGDCWCAPDSMNASKTDVRYQNLNMPAQIGILTSYRVTPDQLVIEHVRPGLTLEPGATPRHIDLLMYIADERERDIIQGAVQNFMQYAHFDEMPIKGFVRIAAFEYNIHDLDNVQIFKIPWVPSTFPFASNRFVVRVRNKWGAYKDGVENVPYTCLYRIKLMGQVFDEDKFLIENDPMN